MRETAAKSLLRLTIGLIALFTLLGLYSYTMYVGTLYDTVDGYLLLLPIARLALMIVIAGVVIGLARPASATLVEGYGALFMNKTWNPGDPGPRALETVAYYVLFLAAIVGTYFMLRVKVTHAVAPLSNLWWVSLAFGLLWLAIGLLVLGLFWSKAGGLKADFAEWSLRRKQSRAYRRMARRVPRAPEFAPETAGPGISRPAGPAAPGVLPGTGVQPATRVHPAAAVAQSKSDVPVTPAVEPKPRVSVTPEVELGSHVPVVPAGPGVSSPGEMQPWGKERPLAPVEAQTCPKCGTELEQRYKFCKKCGAEIPGSY